MAVVRTQEQASFVGLEPLEQRQLLAANPVAVTAITETEPNDRFTDANSFVLPDGGGVKLRGRFQSNDDRDLFTFTATRSGKVLVNLPIRQGFAPQMLVKQAGGRRKFQILPAIDATFGQFQVEVGQSYVIQFTRNEPVGAGKYEGQLRYKQGGERDRDDVGRARNQRKRVVPGPTQIILERELNNSKGTATAFSLPTLDTVSVLRGQSNNTNDRDFFTFRAPRTGTMKFTIKDLNSTIKSPRPMYLQVIDKFGTIVDEVETNGNKKPKGFTGFVDRGQTYFILARAREFKRTFYQVNARYTDVF